MSTLLERTKERIRRDLPDLPGKDLEPAAQSLIDFIEVIFARWKEEMSETD